MNKVLKMSLIGLILFALGAALGRYLAPEKVEVFKEEVIKEVEVVKKDVVYVEKKITRPDGTIEEERRIEDKSETERSRDQASRESKIVQSAKPQWKVSGLVETSYLKKNSSPVYGISVERRIAGPIFVGAWSTTGSNFGVSVGLEF
jgi:hypothetical protein